MNNKILIGSVALLGLLFLSAHLIFKYKFKEFKVAVENYENEQLEYFKSEKVKVINQLSRDGLLELFDEYFDESLLFIEKDTIFTFILFSEKVKYKIGQIDYFECLQKKCVLEKQNIGVRNQIKSKEVALENKFGPTYRKWHPKLKEEKLEVKTLSLEGCSYCYPESYEISFDKNAWAEFEKFMEFYDNEVKSAQIQSKKAESDFSNNVSSTKKALKSGVINYFETRLTNNKSQILSIQNRSKTFNSPAIGAVPFNLTITSFDKQAFDRIVEDAFEEQWRYNSLSTGSMPYSSCYGSTNSCGGWSCSKIKVITGGNGDVLVSIKNTNGRVVRHGYIKGGHSYTFNVPDGNYQVFFYSGNGWNPNKQMISSSCNSLRGGFVSNESVTKDNYINLYSQIMTYELILQQQGNFSTKPSSKSEAF
jgi:hypothetical protein